MKQITSFTINHDYLKPGMYISRVDGDVVTYDMRMKLPNNPAGDYLEDNALHTFEHLFATYVRNTPLSDGVVYVGPMGCRTGFYFLTRDYRFRRRCHSPGAGDTSICAGLHRRDFPAASARSAATTLPMIWRALKAMAREYQPIMAAWTPEQLNYPAEVLTGTASV